MTAKSKNRRSGGRRQNCFLVAMVLLIFFVISLLTNILGPLVPDMGGALVPLFIGWIGDLYGWRTGMLLLYVTFGCVLSVGFWAKPLIQNAIVRTKRDGVLNAAPSLQGLKREGEL